jgi:hypothetical protein
MPRQRGIEPAEDRQGEYQEIKQPAHEACAVDLPRGQAVDRLRCDMRRAPGETHDGDDEYQDAEREVQPDQGLHLGVETHWHGPGERELHNQ